MCIRDRFSLLFDGLKYSSLSNRMRSTSFTEAALKRGITGLEEDYCSFDVVFTSQLRKDLWKALEKGSLSDVHNECRMGDTRLFAFDHVEEAGYQLNRKVVDTEIAKVLEDIHCRGHSRPTQTSDNDELGHHFEKSWRVPFWSSGKWLMARSGHSCHRFACK